MAGHTTVADLINYLNDIEDKDQAVIYQYYLGEHFSVSNEHFAQVAEEFDSLIPGLSDAYDTIAQAVAEACCSHDAHENYCECCMETCEKCGEEE